MTPGQELIEYFRRRRCEALDRRARCAEFDFIARALRPDDITADVPVGWRPLVRDLHRRLLEESPFYRLVQIEKRVGELRVYARYSPLASRECKVAIAAAVYAARVTCEVCSAQGKPRDRPTGPVVLCASCFAADRAAANERGERYAGFVLDYLRSGDPDHPDPEELEAFFLKLSTS